MWIGVILQITALCLLYYHSAAQVLKCVKAVGSTKGHIQHSLTESHVTKVQSFRMRSRLPRIFGYGP